jgi:hypothetical protein
MASLNPNILTFCLSVAPACAAADNIHTQAHSHPRPEVRSPRVSVLDGMEEDRVIWLRRLLGDRLAETMQTALDYRPDQALSVDRQP